MIILLSGGMDSTVLAAHCLAAGLHTEALTVDYGQRHAREIEAAKAVASYFGIRHDVITLPVGPLLTGSALTDPSVDVPDGHYAEPSMAATIVPNRNAMMLMTAAAVAAARGHSLVATAVHAGDHPVYPDCRPEFVEAASRCAALGTAGHGDVEITAPFVTMTKGEIARHGLRLGAPLELSWSCYKGGERPCGTCGTCTERAEAFALAGAPDPAILEAGR